MGARSRSLLYEKRFRIEVEVKRVFAALSLPEEQTRWFTEHSQAMPGPQGSNSFWGKHTLWSRSSRQSTQQFTDFEAPRRLAYRWDLNKRPTEVSFALSAATGGTIVDMRHKLLEGDPERDYRLLVADFWRIALLNLLWYLETDAPMYRLDYRNCKGDIALELQLSAPPSQIFQALTLPAKMDAWLSQQAKVELRVGGCYSFGWMEELDGQKLPAGPTFLLELDQDKRLAYGWQWPGEDARTQVRWELKLVKGGTKVLLSHSGFSPKRDSTGYKQGWAAFLCLLKLYLERGVRWE